MIKTGIIEITTNSILAYQTNHRKIHSFANFRTTRLSYPTTLLPMNELSPSCSTKSSPPSISTPQ